MEEGKLRYKGLGTELLRITTLLKTKEKNTEHQTHIIEHLEKIRDQQIKIAAENAETVRITADTCVSASPPQTLNVITRIIKIHTDS